MRVLIRGAGDLASGVAHVLVQAGMEVLMTEVAQPTVIRRPVSFAECMFEETVEVEGIRARKAGEKTWEALLAAGEIPVLDDPEARIRESFAPAVLVDAILAKKNTGITDQDAPLVIGLGPGFWAGRDVHLVIETQRGHDLGRIIRQGPALPNTGIPGTVEGRGAERVLRAPAEGIFREEAAIGDRVRAGQTLARVGDALVPAPFDGVLRGLLHSGLAVFPGMKVGDVDPRPEPRYCFTISDKARALGGSVLCAILQQRRHTLWTSR